jgi:hypothetical protein
VSDDTVKENNMTQRQSTNPIGRLFLLAALTAVTAGGCGVGAGENTPKTRHGAKPAASILLEAFVTEVKLAALYTSPQDLLGETPEPVSAAKILRFLEDTGGGKFIGGAKLRIMDGGTGQAKCDDNEYVNSSNEDGSAQASDAKNEVHFEAEHTLSATVR